MDVAAFIEELGDFFGFEVAGVDGSTKFWEDLDFDSLDLFQLVMFTEALAGLQVPLEETPILATVQDAFDYYSRSRKRQDDMDDEPALWS